MKRREFLRLAMTAAGSGIVQTAPAPPPVPRVNGGINVFPVRRLEPNAGLEPPIIIPELVDLQMKLVYELGFEQMRMTINFESFGPDFLAAIPYVRSARALGIDVVGVIGEFEGAALVRALTNDETRDDVLETYARIFGDLLPKASESIEATGRFAAQILNEPTHFNGIAPDVYVRDFLRPAWLHLKEDDPTIQIVSAAPVSSAEGFLRAQKMIEAGLEHVCDVVAFHVYGTRFLDRLAGLTEKPVWVTESGAEGISRHLEWLTTTFDEIRNGLPTLEQIYWFDLYDRQPNGFRLFDIVSDPLAGFVSVPESVAAIDAYRARVQEASGGIVRAGYEELIPDITMYFPTEEDIRLIESTSIGLLG